jgi:hypothetical protein
MSSTGALGGVVAGVPSGSGGRKRGRPFGSRNRAKDPAATPPVPRRRGRPPGSRNKRTLAALAAAAAVESAGAAPAAAVAAAPVGVVALAPPTLRPPRRDSPRGSGHHRRRHDCGQGNSPGPHRCRRRWLIQRGRRQGAQASVLAAAVAALLRLGARIHHLRGASAGWV